MIKRLQNNEFNAEETIYKYLYKIPPKSGRYIVLDTETSGLSQERQIVELGAHEIINGKLTGSQFHIYIRPRIQMDKNVINIHKIQNSFYDDFISDFYESDKQNLINFCKFIGNSIIFAHNAPFDINAINNELNFWGLNEIPLKRFRCSMRIFMDVIGKIDIKFDNRFTSLINCCEYFKIKSEENKFHNALFDSFMTAKMIAKIYETLDNNINLRKKMGYNQKALDYFFIDNIVKKSKRKKNDLPKKNEDDDKKSNSKKILNNIDYFKYIKDENIISKKKINNINLSDNKNKYKDGNGSLKKLNKIYDIKIKKESLIEMEKNIIKDEKKKKYNSAKKQEVNNLIQSSIKDSKRKNIKDKIATKKEDENYFENEEDVLDDAFGELL
jgi:DNA polymerase-3 subunit epsilon